MDTKHRVIVVGGGITGLTTATSLAKRGIDTLLVEKNAVCGGLVNSFIREGFLFDGGVRAIENAGMILPMMQELDIDIHLYPSKISVGVEHEVVNVETADSVNDYEEMLKRLYPGHQEDVTRVIGVIRKFDEYMKVLFGNESPFFKDVKRDRRYYLTTFFPWLWKFLATGKAIMKMRMPVEDYLKKIIHDQGLIDIISQHFFKKTPAFFAMSYFSLYTDYYYPEGGVGQLTAKLEQKLGDLGGRVLTETDITAVDSACSRITDQHGNTYGYDRLIWTADLKQLYRILAAEGSPAKVIAAVEREKELILSSKGAESVYTLFMGVDQPPEVYARKAYGHFFYTPSREGLGTLQREDLQALYESWDSRSREDILAWLDNFCRLNTYEISLPVLHDPGAAPEGKTGIIASFLLDHELVRRIRDDGWYEEFAAYIDGRMLEVLDNSIYPGLKEHLLFSFSAGPLAIEERVRSSEGAIVGWSFEQPIPINASMLNMKNSVRTAMPGIFKAGQWAASPAGIPTCILTAKLAADTVFKELS